MKPQDMDAFGPDSYPGALELCEEKRELFRRAAVSALEHSQGGKRLAPDARSWAMHWAAVQPLGRPLSQGEPQ